MTHKICVVTSAPVGARFGVAGFEALWIGERLAAQNRLAGLYCGGYDDVARQHLCSLIRIPGRDLLWRALNRAFRAGGGLLGPSERRIRETTFDVLLSRSIDTSGAQTVLFLKPGFARTAARLRNRQAATCLVGYGATHHPRFNLEQVKAQREATGFAGGGVYDDEKRVRRIEAFYGALHGIVVQSSIAGSTFERYGIAGPRLARALGAFGVDSEKFHPAARPAEDEFVVLHLSNMSLIKGVHLLLDAWKRARLENARLVLAGEMDADIRRMVSAFHASSITLLGPVRDPAAVYARSDIFVSPSISDGQPATVLEAMACGLPVIVSDRCGVAEIVTTGSDGFVYSANSVDELTRHLQWSHAHRHMLPDIGAKARKTATEHSGERFAEIVIAAIDRFRDDAAS